MASSPKMMMTSTTTIKEGTNHVEKSNNNENESPSLSVTDSMRQQSLLQVDKLTQHFDNQKQSKNDNDTPKIWTNQKQISSFIRDHVDTLLFDCDGVLYRGTDLAPNAIQVINGLQNQQQKQCLFVTNNAGTSRQGLRDKLIQLFDNPHLTLDQMIPSSFAAAQYLKHTLSSSSQKPRVHVIGEKGLRDEISQAGCLLTNHIVDDSPSMTRNELAEYPFDGTVDAVVVGLDTSFSYRKLCIANVLLQRNPKAILISTNQDAFDLVGADGRHLPGNGSIVKSIEFASGRTAINVGKPSLLLAQLIARHYNNANNNAPLNPSRTVMVGDRLDTDIQFGNESKMISILVMTGVTTAQNVIQSTMATTRDKEQKQTASSSSSSSSSLVPQIIIPSIEYLVE